MKIARVIQFSENVCINSFAQLLCIYGDDAYSFYLDVWRYYWDTDTIVIEPFVYFLPQFLQNLETSGQKTESYRAGEVNRPKTNKQK